MNIQFGSGIVTFNPSNVNAPLLANPTPQQPTLIQEASVDFKADNKSLFGRSQYAFDVARGQVKSSGKAKVGSTDPMLMNQLYFGMPVANNGTVRPVVGESWPFTAAIAVKQHGAGVFVKDQGVVNGTTGLQMLCVATNPAVGQYTSDGQGNYTFNAGETAATVLISYLYNDATSGISITISNQINGYTPEFEMTMSNSYRGKLFALRLFRCKMTDLSLASKQTDYWMADLSYEICANDAGNIGVIYADQ